MVANGMVIESQFVLKSEVSRFGSEVLHTGERLSDRAPISIRTVGPEATDRARRQFSTVAAMLGRIAHPNCLSALSVGQLVDQTLYVVSLRHEAGTLESLLGEGMPTRELAELGAQLFSGLAHLHAQGVAIGCVSPSGVTLGQVYAQPRLQIIDFSFARALASGTALPENTSEWFAPEAVEHKRATAEADVYSAGLLLKALAGEALPASMLALLDELTAVDPAARPSASDARSKFAEFIDRSAVSFDLGWLPSSSEAVSTGVFGLALDSEILEEREPTQLMVAPTVSGGDYLERPSRGRRNLAIGLGLAGVVAAAVVGFVMVQPAPPQTQPEVAAASALPVAGDESTASKKAETPTPAPVVTDDAPEGNPIVWLSQVNRTDLGAVLSYRHRSRLLRELASREGVYERVNRRWNAMLDLWQAGDADRPCATFAAALASLDDGPQTDEEKDLIRRIVVPTPALGSAAGVAPDESCSGLEEAFAEFTARGSQADAEDTRRRRRPAKASRRSASEPKPQAVSEPRSAPQGKPKSKPKPPRRTSSSVATRLDDDLKEL